MSVRAGKVKKDEACMFVCLNWTGCFLIVTKKVPLNFWPTSFVTYFPILRRSKGGGRWRVKGDGLKVIKA